MAKFINQDISITVGSTDLSDHGFATTAGATRDQIDTSGYNATGAKSFLPGSTDETVTIQFRQDFASGKVHSTLEPLYRNSSTFTLVIKPTSGGVSATNPAFAGTAALFEYTGLDGNLGDVSNITAVFKSADALAPLAWRTA